MSDLEERLLARVGSVAEVLSAGDVVPILIGGLAVRLQVQRLMEREDTIEEYLSDSEPSVLARRTRVTTDIDFGVRDALRARDLLRRIDFDGNDEFSVTDGETQVDLLPFGTGVYEHRLASVALSLFSNEYDEVEVHGVAQHVASSAILVLLKAISWRDRSAPKDLADIARIALADWRSRATAQRLGLLAESMGRELRAELARAHAAFDGHGSSGATAFLDECLGKRGFLFDDDSMRRDDDIRATITQAVERLFAFVEW